MRKLLLLAAIGAVFSSCVKENQKQTKYKVEVTHAAEVNSKDFTGKQISAGEYEWKGVNSNFVQVVCYVSNSEDVVTINIYQDKELVKTKTEVVGYDGAVDLFYKNYN